MNLPAKETKYPHITIDPGILSGQPVVEGTRVSVVALVRAHQLGMDFDEILMQYPGLKPEDLHAAFVYYFDFKKEIDDSMQEQTYPIAEATQTTV